MQHSNGPDVHMAHQAFLQSPHVSSADVLVLERQLHQVQRYVLTGKNRHCVPVTVGGAEEPRSTQSERTLGSTMLTMTSWYARSLKACATVWSTLIVSV